MQSYVTGIASPVGFGFSGLTSKTCGCCSETLTGPSGSMNEICGGSGCGGGVESVNVTVAAALFDCAVPCSVAVSVIVPVPVHPASGVNGMSTNAMPPVSI